MSYDDTGSIPDLITLSKIPVNFAQKIETDLLEPVVFSNGSPTQDGFCRFTLQNKGFLHSHSKLFLSVEVNASVTSANFNPVTGVGQVIKKAVLKIGNKTLNEVSSWDSLFAVKSALIKNENNMEREYYTTGRFMNHKFQYAEGSIGDTATRYELENGWEYDGEHPGELAPPTWAESDGNLQSLSPTFSIDLSDLFPFLKVNQLPLYMIREPINIELHFYPTTSDRIQINGSNTGKEAFIRREDLKFCADYVFYGESDEMERFANANKDMSFSFVDYRLVETSVNATSLTNGIIRNLGMANRVVPRILTLLSDDAKTETNILTRANSQAPHVNASGVPGTIKYNIRYNDRYEFSSDVDNTARLFSILTDAEGVPFITRSEYNNEKNTIGASTFQGRNQSTELAGQFFYLGTKLTGGRVGQRGLELHFQGTYTSTTASLMRNFCEYLRVARLSNGMFDVFNA